MLYLCAKLIAKISFFSVYRKVYIINEDNVPGDRAALVTCNHPNGFVEPLVIGGYIPHSLYFLVRGSAFENKIARYLLNAIHCIPIFRFRDGFAMMRKNNKSMSASVNILSEKNPLIVFAEGSTQQVRYVRPIQKGAIRLAFDTLTNAPESDPCIIPSVIHFSNPQFYRSEVVMEYGEPINVADYGELYKTHKAKAIKSLLDDTNKAMQVLSISVDPAIDTQDADTVFEIARSTVRDKNIFPIIQKVRTSPNRDAERIAGNNFSELNETDRNEIIGDINKLKTELDQVGINYEQLTGRTKSTLFNIVFLVLGFLPFIIGRVLNIIPIKIGQAFSKSKVKKDEFKAVMKLMPFLIFYPIYLLFLGLIFGIGGWLSGLGVLLVPVLGWFSFVYEGQFKEFIANRKFNALSQDAQQKLSTIYQNILPKLLNNRA